MTEIHAQRRAALMASIDAPVLLMGNRTRYRNSAYTLPFRQDSTFLYYTGCAQPGAALLLARGQATLFLTPPADDDALSKHLSVFSEVMSRVHVSIAGNIQ